MHAWQRASIEGVTFDMVIREKLDVLPPRVRRALFAITLVLHTMASGCPYEGVLETQTLIEGELGSGNYLSS